MRNFLILAILVMLTGCVAMQPQQYREVQTFTGPVAVPVETQPQRVTAGVSGDNLGLSGWLRVVIAGNCYLTPSVSTGYGDGPRKYVRVQC